MSNLIEILTENTQELKSAFIEKTKEYATRMYNVATENCKKDITSFFSTYGIETYVLGYNNNDWQIMPNSRNAYAILKRDRKNWFNITNKSYEVFETKEIKYANEHYKNSLIKLAIRLEKKGIKDNFEVVSGFVGLNFEVIIKHGNTTTKAWTIIAEGPIQRVHYRYLVK